MKKKKSFLIPLLMAIVMMAMCPTKVWADCTEHNFPEASNGFCTECGAYEPLGTPDEDGWYEIKNAGQLYSFAALVIGGTNRSAKGRLANDIVINDGTFDANGNFTAKDASTTSTPRSWVPMGYEIKNISFTGEFDGNGHTISGLYYNSDRASIGFIGYAVGATIQNVGIVNAYISNDDEGVGAICGLASNETTIKRCWSDGIVKGGYRIGGICGYNKGNSIIEDCYSSATVSASNGEVGGICGYNYSSIISNCYSTSTVSASSAAGIICGYNYNRGEVTKCYSPSGNAIGTNDEKATATDNVDNVEPERFASGEITYLLNGKRSAGTADDPLLWYQKLPSTGSGQAVDSYPVLKKDGTNNTVYLVYGEKCTDTPTYSNTEQTSTSAHDLKLSWTWADDYKTATLTLTCRNDASHKLEGVATVTSKYECDKNVYTATINLGGVEYSNIKAIDLPDESKKNHVVGNNFDANGIKICSVCGKSAEYQPLGTPVDGWYSISNAGQLCSFAQMVTENPSVEYNAKLTNDIDMSDVTYFAPICYATSTDNLSYNKSDISQPGFNGIFDAQCHTISNLTIVNNSAYFSAGLFGNNSGTIRNLGIENFSYNQDDVDGRFGAVAGVNFGTIQNCFVTGSTVSSSEQVCGAIAGGNYGGTIEYSYEANNTIENLSRCGHLVGEANNDGASLKGVITNCYSDGKLGNEGQAGYAGDGQSDDANVTTARFASGDIAFLLNDSRSAGTADNPLVWYQKLGKGGDSYPVLKKASDGSNTVYAAYGTKCSDRTYNNVAGSGTPNHYWYLPRWTWSDDCTTAQIALTCQNDCHHKLVGDATVSNVTTGTSATCETDGHITYTATIHLGGNDYSNNKIVNDATKHATGHTFAGGATSGTCTECGKIIVAQGYDANAAGIENAIHWQKVENVKDGARTGKYTIEVTGIGAIKDYANSSEAPWFTHTSEGNRDYDGDGYVTSIIIGSGITRIGNFAFAEYKGLNSLTIPEGVESLGSKAFAFAGYSTAYDGGLEEVVLPASLKTIGEYAFRQANIKVIRFAEGSQLESIEQYAFGSHFIQSVTFTCATKPTIDDKAFANEYETAVLNANLNVIYPDNASWGTMSGNYGGLFVLWLKKIGDQLVFSEEQTPVPADYGYSFTTMEKAYDIKLFSFKAPDTGDFDFQFGLKAPEGHDPWNTLSYQVWLYDSSLNKSTAYKEVFPSIFNDEGVVEASWNLKKGETYYMKLVSQGVFDVSLNIPDVVSTNNEGTFGTDNKLTWHFDSSDGTLTLGGEGAVNERIVGSAPYSKYRDQIKKVVVGNGITCLGYCSFQNGANIESMEFEEGSKCERLGNYTFHNTKIQTLVLPPSVKYFNEAFSGSKITKLYMSTPELEQDLESDSLRIYSEIGNKLHVYFLHKKMYDQIKRNNDPDGYQYRYIWTKRSGGSDNVLHAPVSICVQWKDENNNTIVTELASVYNDTEGARIDSYTFNEAALEAKGVNPHCHAKWVDENGNDVILGKTFTDVTSSIFLTSVSTHTDGSGVCSTCNIAYQGDINNAGGTENAIHWQIEKNDETDTYTLEISGVGEMPNYDLDGEMPSAPWFIGDEVRSKVTTINVRQGITSIGDYAFYQYGAVTSVDIPYGVELIGESAFYQCFDNIDRLILPKSLVKLSEYALKDAKVKIVEFEGESRITYLMEQCLSSPYFHSVIFNCWRAVMKVVDENYRDNSSTERYIPNVFAGCKLNVLFYEDPDWNDILRWSSFYYGSTYTYGAKRLTFMDKNKLLQDVNRSEGINSFYHPQALTLNGDAIRTPWAELSQDKMNLFHFYSFTPTKSGVYDCKLDVVQTVEDMDVFVYEGDNPATYVDLSTHIANKNFSKSSVLPVKMEVGKTYYFKLCSGDSRNVIDISIKSHSHHEYATKTLSASADEKGLYVYDCDYGCGLDQSQNQDYKIVKNYKKNSDGTYNHLELTVGETGNLSTDETIALTDDNQFANVNATFTSTAEDAPTYTRANINKEWGTIVLPFAVAAQTDDYDLYSCETTVDDYIVLKKLSANEDVPAGYPAFVYKKTDAKSITFTATGNSNTVNTADSSTPSVGTAMTLCGTYAALPLTSSNTGTYFIYNNKFWNVNQLSDGQTVTILPFHAYIKGASSEAEPGSMNAKLMIVVDEDNATSINNEQLIINNVAGAVYNLNGQRLSAPQKGINIINGKKVMVK